MYNLILCPFQYCIIIFLLSVLLLGGGICGLVFKEKELETLKDEMIESLKQYSIGSDNILTTAWNSAQEEVI